MDFPLWAKVGLLLGVVVGGPSAAVSFHWEPAPCKPVVRELNYVGDFECPHAEHTMRLLTKGGRYDDAVAACDCPNSSVKVERDPCGR